MFGLRYLPDDVTQELDQEACTGCGTCLTVCPHQVFELAEDKALIRDRDACMECGACSTNCPEGALTVESGVGCAAGIIAGALSGTEPTCDCGSDDSSCC
jgi:NAD-dependent dihydropyrimidine dehydrogenase PreA subunit